MPRLRADWLIDGTGAATVRYPAVYVENGRIARIESEATPQVDDQYFPGCSILPGLIDTHVHLCFSAGLSHAEVLKQVCMETERQLVARAIGNAQAALRAGVTTLRDCGDRALVSLTVRDAIRDGPVEGPDVIVCGMPITTTNGHLHFLGLVADSQTEVQSAAERMLAAGADFLKIIATGGNMTPSSNRLACQYDLASLRSAVEIGRKAGRHTAAHVLAKCGIEPCVAAGVRTIEHCMWRVSDDMYCFDPALAKRLADGEHFAGFTMTAPTWRSVIPEMANIDRAMLGDLDVRFMNERRTIDAGVKFTLHTDAGVRRTPFGESLAIGVGAAVRELHLTPMEAIQAVTKTAAEAIGVADRGVLAIGKRADLIVVDGNVLQDISALRRVRAVMKNGTWNRNSKPAQIE